MRTVSVINYKGDELVGMAIVIAVIHYVERRRRYGHISVPQVRIQPPNGLVASSFAIFGGGARQYGCGRPHGEDTQWIRV